MAVREVTRPSSHQTYWLVSYQEQNQTLYLGHLVSKQVWRRCRHDQSVRRPLAIHFHQRSLALLGSLLARWLISGRGAEGPLGVSEIVARARIVLTGNDPQEDALLASLDVQVAIGSTRRRRWRKFYQALKETPC